LLLLSILELWRLTFLAQREYAQLLWDYSC